MALVGGRRLRAAEGGELGERATGSALLPPQLGFAQGPGQQGVAPRVSGHHHQVRLVRSHPRIGLAHGHGGASEGDLGAEDGGQPQLAGGLGEADHAVEAVVVGEGERLQAEAGGLLHQRFGRAGPVEEAEVRVAVQLGVGHRPPVSQEGGRLVGLALA